MVELRSTASVVVPRTATTRRGTLAWSGWSTLGLIGLQAATAFVLFIWPRRTGTFGKQVAAGSPNDYAVGEITYFTEGKFYLVRLAEGFLALYQKCPHLGCTVPWQPKYEQRYGKPGSEIAVTGVFKCPCHGSAYLPNGQNIFGPAPRPLDLMRLQLVNGRLVVDTASVTKRERWDPRQAFRV